MTIIAPKNKYELREAFRCAMTISGPVAVRYPRGQACEAMAEYHAPFICGKSELIHPGRDVVFLAVGSMVQVAWEVQKRLQEERGIDGTLVNVRFVKPLDTVILDALVRDHSLFVTMEENVLSGGFGEHVGGYLHHQNLPVRLLSIAIPDMYVEHGNVDILKREVGIDADSVYARVCQALEERD